MWHVYFRAHSVAWLFLCAAVATMPAYARLVHNMTTEQLTPLADIICTGRVIDLWNTLEKGTTAVPNWEKETRVPIEFWLARVQVLNTTKGSVPREIQVRFPQIDQHPAGSEPTVICDGPIQIAMEKGRRYRFFLKPVAGQPWYVGVLDGQYDDAFAVQPLADIEPDDSPPTVSRNDAVQIAGDYVKKLNPATDITNIPLEAREEQGRWTVEYWSPHARPHQIPAEARIHVVGKGQIDRGSWVADLCTTSVDELKPSDVGRQFRVYMQEYPKDKKFYPTITFPPMIVLGTLKTISPAEIELSDVWQYNTGNQAVTWPALTIPIRDIHWFQRLVPAPISARDH